ncbi:MAG: vWA domain-containing protein [Flammeovirgaceae bacterium]
MDKNWFSFEWFSYEVLKGFEWKNPILLWLLLIVPFLFVIRWLLLAKSRQKLSLALPEYVVEKDPWSWLRFIPRVFLGLSMAMIIIALARPQRTSEQVEQWTEGIDIMLVLDVSISMKLPDFHPNRLEATKKVAAKFIDGRFRDRIGSVIFSGEAVSYVPLTTDYDMLKSLISNINFKMIPKGGTAIGSAIAVGVSRMQESTAKSKVLVVLSDGENNAGSIDPITAANLAYAYDIKIYTIGVGKQERIQTSVNPLTGDPIYSESRLDEELLKEIAKIGKGKYFRAQNNRALQEVFDEVDRLEKSEIQETRYKDIKDFYFQYLTFGIVFFLIWLATKSTFMTNAMED